jgi:hypothetical protein
MTITRGLAAAAMLAGLAGVTAATAWADTTMSGHYIETETGPAPYTSDWYVTPCGDGCASIIKAGGGGRPSQAHLVDGQWTVDTTGGPAICPDGTSVPDAVSAHYTWDPNTLTGTVQTTNTAPACGFPTGFSFTNDLQLTQAP